MEWRVFDIVRMINDIRSNPWVSRLRNSDLGEEMMYLAYMLIDSSLPDMATERRPNSVRAVR